MRPGAAVRLRGTWRDDTQVNKIDNTPKDAVPVAASLQKDSPLQAPSDSANNEPSIAPVEAHNKKIDTSSSTSTTAELRVNEVEVLGRSDPQVLNALLSSISCYILSNWHIPDISYPK